MYSTIAVPVDLAHPDTLDKALATAADLGRLYDATVHLVAVTSTAPSAIAPDPDAFRARLDTFAREQGQRFGLDFEAEMLVAKDPSVELDRTLDRHFHALGVDLVVMASHVPGFRDYVFSSRAGYLASHSDLSVLVVR